VRLSFVKNRFWHTERQKFRFLFLTSNNTKKVRYTSRQQICPRNEIYVPVGRRTQNDKNYNVTYTFIRKYCRFLFEIFLFLHTFTRTWLGPGVASNISRAGFRLYASCKKQSTACCNAMKHKVMCDQIS